jgi:hypothetical protein
LLNGGKQQIDSCLCFRRIEELKQSLVAHERLVEQLSQEKQQLLHLLEEPASMEVQVRFGLCILGFVFCQLCLILL